MRKHNGVKSQDIVLLIKIAITKDENWTMKDLANELKISAGEVSESLNRSVFSGLLFPDKKRVMKASFLDFLKFGLKYIFPVRLGGLGRGKLTAYSAEPLTSLVHSSDKIVWMYAKGKDKGIMLEPLYPSIPEVCEKDSELYEALSLVETFRIGKVREVELAYEELKKRL